MVAAEQQVVLAAFEQQPAYYDQEQEFQTDPLPTAGRQMVP